ncbi:GGDEF-domain containing protein [Camelimonas fluminis]|uniref:EAL domain-containing protein n=1 Tax=Camelimonas fluminis TaxID=1576911 RepID=A0ABV7UJX6_9HYPH|nr:EAL domain-containing protein [Camelimonas fluminis]GHE53937.1 GGDEF-domain containing protein [Camelimonas fluminis]
MTAVRAVAPAPAPPERALDPAQGLMACHMAAWAWDLASDRLTWGPTAMAALGFERRRHLSSGKAWASLVAPGSGESRADVIHGAAGPDHGEGAPFRCRYVVNAGRGLCVIEERGRWHAGPDGRPARAEGVMRVCPIDGRQPDVSLAGRRMEPARDIVTRTLTAMLHDPARGLRSVSVAVCLIMPLEPDVSASDPVLMDLAAAAIARRLRRTDVVAVLDPGQFAIILNGCDDAQGRQAAAAVARNVARACAGVQAHVGLVTASDGVGDAGSLLERAGEAARQAVEAGEMVAVLAPRVRRRPAARPHVMSTPDVVALLNSRDIGLRRRRLVDLDGAGLHLDEALPVAACAGGAGVMGPGLLAPVAAQAGLSGLLDQRMLEQAVRLLAADPAAHVLLRIAPATLVSPEWRGAVAAWLAAHPGVSARLVIALDEAAFGPGAATPARNDAPKESAPVHPTSPGIASCGDAEGQVGEDVPPDGAQGHDPRAIGQHLTMMKALGVSVGVTGFGLGWLKLEDLSAMAVDVVCMSGLFVNESLSLVGPDRFVVRALVDGAREIGAAVVAPAP